MKKTAAYELRLLRSRLANAKKKLLSIGELRCSHSHSMARESRRIRVFERYLQQGEIVDSLERQIAAVESDLAKRKGCNMDMNSINFEQLGSDFTVYQECRIYSLLYRNHRIVSGSKMEVTKAVDAIASFIALSKEVSE